VFSALAVAVLALAPTPAHPSMRPTPAPKPEQAAFRSLIEPLSPAVRERIRENGYWRRGCPVPLSGLRILTVTHRGFDGRSHTGEIVVNAKAAEPLSRVFRKLYALRFPIREMTLDFYAANEEEFPAHGDVTASFSCRKAVPSPCTGKPATGGTRWSNHAYGLAVDVNPVENPYVGCGMSRDPKARRYRDRSRHRRGMLTPRAIAAFASVGWGWGGAWSGETKDYMHFSVTGG
jgi:D-alanyl-D-alanine carboxypeptidase